MKVWLWDIEYEGELVASGAAVSRDAAVRAAQSMMNDLWQDEDTPDDERAIQWDDDTGQREEHTASLREYELDT